MIYAHKLLLGIDLERPKKRKYLKNNREEQQRENRRTFEFQIQQEFSMLVNKFIVNLKERNSKWKSSIEIYCLFLDPNENTFS